MDDLSGLNWSQPSQEGGKKPVMNSSTSFGALRPTPPISGRSTPLSAQIPSGQGRSSNPSSKPATPANDSFSNLVSFGPNNSNKNLSLAEQQKRLAEQRAQQQAAKKQAVSSQYEVKDSQFWDTLGSGRSTPTIVQPQRVGQLSSGSTPFGNQSAQVDEEEDDLLAAFNASAPVDASTHFPVPRSSNPTPTSVPSTAAKSPPVTTQSNGGLGGLFGDDDDDPFGLGQMKPAQSNGRSMDEESGDDDVLGLLGKPVSDIPRQPERHEEMQQEEPDGARPPTEPRDRAVAELVEMGFPAGKAREALDTTESGTDLQSAVGWLLNQAHSESRQKNQSRATPIRTAEPTLPERRPSGQPESRSRRERQDEEPVPAWMRGDRNPASDVRRNDSRSPANGEKDPARIAAEIGNNLYSFWKVGTKKVQQAVQEFNSDSDSSQPKWMREPAGSDRPVKGRSTQDGPRGRRISASEQPATDSKKQPDLMTDEAMLLESDRSRPPPRKVVQDRRESRFAPDPDSSRDSSPSLPARPFPQNASPTPQRQEKPQPMDPRSRLSRQAVEEQSSQAYVSPARRRKGPTKPAVPDSEPDLLFNSNAAQTISRPTTSSPAPRVSRPAREAPLIAVRPKAPQRSIPPVSSIALSQSHSHRQKGTDAYKRGDYAAAHSSYSSALSSLPDKHPITIIILSNRAMTGLKVGEPKAAVADADIAIALIGPSKGESETINLENGEAPKDMKEFYGKALMRKAEALEHLERWTEAANVWKEAVEAGHGGSTSIAGRNRCEKAAGINQPTKPAPRKPPPKRAPPRKISALDDLSGNQAGNTASSAEAVTRLREAHAAAERADDEKFALADTVDAKLSAWKGGKADNLRALLGSLDTVLWPEAGWKKVGMSELVLPNKVKIVYMRGISKVHPDKIPTAATTEQRMISGAVFSTLNEAWDKFRRENGL